MTHESFAMTHGSLSVDAIVERVEDRMNAESRDRWKAEGRRRVPALGDTSCCGKSICNEGFCGDPHGGHCRGSAARQRNPLSLFSVKRCDLSGDRAAGDDEAGCSDRGACAERTGSLRQACRVYLSSHRLLE